MATRGRSAKNTESHRDPYTHCKAAAIIADTYAWEKQYLWEQLSLIASI